MADIETIVITSEDLEEVEVEAPAEENQQPQKPKMPTWRRLLTSLLIFFPPVLFVVCIVDLVRTHRPERVVLVTCGGTYDRDHGGWDSNVVVTFVQA